MDKMCTNVKWMDAIARKMNTLRLSASKNARTYCVPASAYIFFCSAARALRLARCDCATKKNAAMQLLCDVMYFDALRDVHFYIRSWFMG